MARRFAGAAGPPDLLVVGIDRVADVEVVDQADARLVDAHAEGDRGDDHLRLVATWFFLGFVGVAILTMDGAPCG